jgi:hypothetical protein
MEKFSLASIFKYIKYAQAKPTLYINIPLAESPSRNFTATISCFESSKLRQRDPGSAFETANENVGAISARNQAIARPLANSWLNCVPTLFWRTTLAPCKQRICAETSNNSVYVPRSQWDHLSLCVPQLFVCVVPLTLVFNNTGKSRTYWIEQKGEN